MKDSSNTKKELVAELSVLKKKIKQLEKIKFNHAEEALWESEDKYRRITENMSDLLSDVDINGSYKYVSPSFRRMLGYAPEDILGTPVFDKVHPEDMDWVLAEFTEGIKTKTDREVEYRYQHADGHYIWLRSASNSLFDAAGEFVGAIINSSNISNRKQAEDELRLSRKHYRELVENINDVIFTVDLEGNFTFVSPVIERLSGYTVGEVEGLSFSRFVHPDDMQGLVESFMQTASGIRVPHEFRVLDKTGDVRWVVTMSTLVTEGGNTTGVTGTMTDITKRKLAEEELLKSEKQYRDLVENLNDVIYQVRMDGTIIYVSPSLERVLGYTPAEVKDKRFDFAVHPHDRDKLLNIFVDHIQGNIYPYEYRMISRDGMNGGCAPPAARSWMDSR